MLERLIAQVSPGSIDKTLHIASAWASAKDPLPGLAITVMAERDSGRQLRGMTTLTELLCKRVGRRTTLQHGDVSSAILWWLSPECPACHGLGHLVLTDAPMLADASCPICLGSKRKPHLATTKGYAATLEALDCTWAWARRVSETMPLAFEARATAEAV